MKIVPLPEVESRPRRVAIGTFDGIHLGHRKVIEGSDTVLTFDPHPVSVIHPESAPKLLTPNLEFKARLLAQIGVEEMVVIPFDKQFAHIDPQHFMDDIIVAKLGATRVSIGENFRFGRQAKGDPEMLRAHAGFEVRTVKLVEQGGEIVSSTQIRGLVAAGEVERADELLGYRFTMVDEVVHGDKRGRELGFPTLNVVPGEHDAVPGHGVYAAFTNGMPSAVNVGIRPTFKTGRGLLVESHVLDWEGDLYGQTIEIEFAKRLRGERRYESAEALIEQMRADVEQVRGVCADAG